MTDVHWAAIIVSYMPGPELKAAVEAVLAAGADRVVVWDNSPDDSAADLLAGVHGPVLVHGDGTNYGFGVANNKAAETLRGEYEYLFLVNPDCIVREDTPEKLLAALQQNDRLAAVSPRMRYPDGKMGIAGGPFPIILKEVGSDTGIDGFLPEALRDLVLREWGWRPGRRGSGAYGVSFKESGVNIVDWISGFAIMTRADRFVEVGGFDSNYFLYFEDVDLAHSFRDKGYGVAIVGQAEALHLESISTSVGGKSNVYKAGRRVYFSRRGGRLSRFVARRIWGRADV